MDNDVLPFTWPADFHEVVAFRVEPLLSVVEGALAPLERPATFLVLQVCLETVRPVLGVSTIASFFRQVVHQSLHHLWVGSATFIFHPRPAVDATARVFESVAASPHCRAVVLPAVALATGRRAAFFDPRVVVFV